MSRLSLPGAFLLAVFATACSEAPTAVPEVPDALAAKGGVPGPPSDDSGDGDGSDSSDPTVDDTDPDSAPQDTMLDVRVFGTNFDSGSKADFLLDGQSTKTVKTNSTTFVSDTELVANITIAADAEPELYDVQVTTSKGRKGVGIELFEIVGPTTDLETATAESGPGLYEDGRGFYIGAFNTNTTGNGSKNNGTFSGSTGNYNTRPQCDEGRSMDLVLPAVWVVDGTVADCNDPGQVMLHIPDLLFADCSDWCPVPAPDDDDTLRYFFRVDLNGNGKFGDRDDTSYNVVWTDGMLLTTRWGGDGTPCAWTISAKTADLWSEGVLEESPGQAVALDVVVNRYDGPCAF